MADWTLQSDAAGIAWLELDRADASANTLSESVIGELDALLAPLCLSPPRGLVIRSGKANGFIAGADIHEFAALTSEARAFEKVRRAQAVLERIERLPCPTVALLHGFALGGGFELALACRYRVAVDDAALKLGLPEVKLGIHPGFGGTVRAVALLGAQTALDLMLTGRSVGAEEALRLGLVDVCVPAPELEAAARALITHPPRPHRPRFAQRLLGAPGVRSVVRARTRARLERKVSPEHYPAPYALLDLWADYGARGARAYEAEARSIARLFLTDSSRSLVRVFELQEALKGLAGRAAPAALRQVHVVGAGVMGGDIAAWCALRGLEVTLQDRESKLIEPALERAAALMKKRLRDPALAAAAIGRLRADVTGTGVAEADVVIEAIFENLDAKRALYATLEAHMRPQALLATNTSSLMLEPLAQGLANPARLIGLHFFNPVAQMPLVEIVRTPTTPPEVLQGALAFLRRIDRLPVPCRSSPGFLVNRVLAPYQQEAMLAVEEGLPLEAIDAVAVRFGMPVGPLELADVVGLDVCQHVGEILAAGLRRPVPELPRLRALVAAGRLGRKSGEGFYRWHEGKVVKGPARPSPAPPDLEDRLVLALLNEAVACLREGVVESGDLLDAAVIFGTGFAPFRGGPLAYARRRGSSVVVARLEELAARHGPRFAPDPAWRDLDRLGTSAIAV